MALPEIAADHGALSEISGEFEALEKKIQTLYKEWDDLLAELGPN
jgi:hypothetical protein